MQCLFPPGADDDQHHRYIFSCAKILKAPIPETPLPKSERGSGNCLQRMTSSCAKTLKAIAGGGEQSLLIRIKLNTQVDHFNAVLENYPFMRRTMESVAAERSFIFIQILASAYLHVCLSVCLSLCLSVCLSGVPSVQIVAARISFYY